MSYQTEEEQLAALIRLWKKYASKILVGIVVIVVLFYGYHLWSNHQKEKSEKAASLYIQLTGAVSGLQWDNKMTKSQNDTFRHVLSRLEKEHPGSIYTQFARLMSAKIAVTNHDMKEAKKSLNTVISTSSDHNIKTLASIRLAAILTDESPASQSGAQQALELLEKISHPGAFVVSIETAKGDAYLALNAPDKARKAYEKALVLAEKEGVQRPLIKLKLDNIPPSKETHK